MDAHAQHITGEPLDHLEHGLHHTVFGGSSDTSVVFDGLYADTV